MLTISSLKGTINKTVTCVQVLWGKEKVCWCHKYATDLKPHLRSHKTWSSSKYFKAGYNSISWLVTSESWVPLVFRKSLLGSHKCDRREETREVSSTGTTEDNEADERGSNRKSLQFCSRG
ncbi:hypothetical protein TNCV_4225701 [Trichonephila clavipes]|uniref:Uncharacterized protein n=1 Tax=Trichonephila clavipes TaxID=2585209 RepID=A0A8X6T3A9_TRICX|nr:hypothetical protein TNCV_4225701 [Trichonephila clavipes]